MNEIATFLFLALTIVCVQCQRPSYLGVGSGPIGRPGLANRFKTPEIEAEEEAAQLAAHQQAELAMANAGNAALSNRFGADGTMMQGLIPVDARGDVDLVNRLNEWPRENRPFWLLNAAAIEGHRGNAVDASTVVQGQAPTQGQQNQSAPFETLQQLGTVGQQQQRQQIQQIQQIQQVQEAAPAVPVASEEMPSDGDIDDDDDDDDASQ